MLDGITNFLAKLTKYEWLNVLIPGGVAVVLCRVLSLPAFTAENWFERIVVYFIWGEIVSRIGAVIIEPMMKSCGMVRFAKYADYIAYSSKNKDEANHLLGNANLCRTMIALGLVLFFIRIYYMLPVCGHVRCLTFVLKDIALLGWSMLFMAAYCRQVKFIVGRVEEFKKLEGA